MYGVPWAHYLAIAALRGEKAVPKIAYLDGAMELMSPSRTHESIKSDIGRLIEAFALAWTCYTPIVRAEAAYVHRAALARGGEGFSEMVLPPMVEGGRMSALAYLDAMHQREQVRAALAAILAKADAIVLPTTSTPAPLRGQAEVDAAGATKMSAREALLGQTVPFSLVGLPALSVPTGTAAGLPAALQIVGAADAAARVLALGRWVEARLA